MRSKWNIQAKTYLCQLCKSKIQLMWTKKPLVFLYIVQIIWYYHDFGSWIMKLSSRVWKYCSTSAELARHACCNIFTQVRIISLSNFQSHDNSIIFFKWKFNFNLCLESRYKFLLKTMIFINPSDSSLEEHCSTNLAIRVRVRALPKKKFFFLLIED